MWLLGYAGGRVITRDTEVLARDIFVLSEKSLTVAQTMRYQQLEQLSWCRAQPKPGKLGDLYILSCTSFMDFLATLLVNNIL